LFVVCCSLFPNRKALGISPMGRGRQLRSSSFVVCCLLFVVRCLFPDSQSSRDFATLKFVSRIAKLSGFPRWVRASLKFVYCSLLLFLISAIQKNPFFIIATKIQILLSGGMFLTFFVKILWLVCRGGIFVGIITKPPLPLWLLCYLCGFFEGTRITRMLRIYTDKNKTPLPLCLLCYLCGFFPIKIFTAEQAEDSQRTQRKTPLPLWLLCWLCGFFEGRRIIPKKRDKHGSCVFTRIKTKLCWLSGFLKSEQASAVLSFLDLLFQISNFLFTQTRRCNDNFHRNTIF